MANEYWGENVYILTAMTDSGDIELRRLEPQEIREAAAMAGRGMRENPLSYGLFGDDPNRRTRALSTLFHFVLASLGHPSLVARKQGAIVGIAAMAPPDGCMFRQATAREKTLKIGSRRIRVALPHFPRGLFWPMVRLGPRSLSQLSEAARINMEHDPKEKHQHVELVVVEAGMQGMGIGRLMMDELCREMDRLPGIAHLETDKESNVRFYEHYGFEVSGESTILGARNWYMERRRP